MIARVVVFLLLGAVVNVAVAWGCHAWAPQNRFDVDPPQQSEVPTFFDKSWDPPSHERIRVVVLGGFGYRWFVWDLSSDPMKPRHLSVTHAGWPCEALSAQVHDGDVRRGVVVALLNKKSRVRPLNPIWPGFAINTLFYAAILWLLFAAPGRVRRWRRIRRGLCAKCAYPVGTSEVCTECGASVKVSASRHPAPLR